MLHVSGQNISSTSIEYFVYIVNKKNDKSIFIPRNKIKFEQIHGVWILLQGTVLIRWLVKLAINIKQIRFQQPRTQLIVIPPPYGPTSNLYQSECCSRQHTKKGAEPWGRNCISDSAKHTVGLLYGLELRTSFKPWSWERTQNDGSLFCA